MQENMSKRWTLCHVSIHTPTYLVFFSWFQGTGIFWPRASAVQLFSRLSRASLSNIRCSTFTGIRNTVVATAVCCCCCCWGHARTYSSWYFLEHREWGTFLWTLHWTSLWTGSLPYRKFSVDLHYEILFWLSSWEIFSRGKSLRSVSDKWFHVSVSSLGKMFILV